jgi:hypothetical protein
MFDSWNLRRVPAELKMRMLPFVANGEGGEVVSWLKQSSQSGLILSSSRQPNSPATTFGELLAQVFGGSYVGFARRSYCPYWSPNTPRGLAKSLVGCCGTRQK